MSDAGADSPHLAREEREQAAQHAAPAALVIHEAVREEGEQELRKRPVAVWWSGLAAGMSMGFSFLCMACSLPHVVIGNTIGGVALVAMLNHAPLADELKPDRSRGDSDLEP